VSVPLDPTRLKLLLETARREALHLLGTTERLFREAIDADWVRALDAAPELAERLDAFVARFGRLQDNLGDKVIPELRRQSLEQPGAALDNLNRMEKLGLLPSVADWVQARNLRNRLVHEYVRDPDELAGALLRARELVPLLVQTYNRTSGYAGERFAGAGEDWPPPVAEL
jgi:hypothetical protein